MGTLHLVNSVQALDGCLTVAAAADTIVLIEDGAYAANGHLPTQHRDTGDAAKVAPTCYVIAADLEIRGVANPHGLTQIDYDELVVLCTQHSPIATWC